MKKVAFFIFICFFMENQAQEFNQYRWENRLILLKTSSLNERMYQDQIKILSENNEGLKERKLLVFTLINDSYFTGIFPNTKLNDIENVKKKKGKTSDNVDFEFILIGLDGSEKYTSSQPVSIQYLFSKIDQMPMRRSELIKNN